MGVWYSKFEIITTNWQANTGGVRKKSKGGKQGICDQESHLNSVISPGFFNLKKTFWHIPFPAPEPSLGGGDKRLLLCRFGPTDSPQRALTCAAASPCNPPLSLLSVHDHAFASSDSIHICRAPPIRVASAHALLAVAVASRRMRPILSMWSASNSARP